MPRSHRPDQENPDPSRETRTSGLRQSSGSVSIQSASEGRPCPYLGCREWPTSPHARPSRDNVCYVRPGTRKKGIRKTRVPYSPVSREKQSTTCLKSFFDCPYYQKASSEAPEHNESKKSSPEFTAAGPAQKPGSKIPRESRKKKRKRARSRNKSPYNSLPRRWRSAVQIGGAFVACAIAALGLYLFLSANPSSFIDYIFTTIARNDFRAFVAKYRKTRDRPAASDMAKGRNPRALKKLSKSEKDKLKNSAVVKRLSQAQKERIKRQLGLK